jgi:hypothetical protein
MYVRVVRPNLARDIFSRGRFYLHFFRGKSLSAGLSSKFQGNFIFLNFFRGKFQFFLAFLRGKITEKYFPKISRGNNVKISHLGQML